MIISWLQTRGLFFFHLNVLTGEQNIFYSRQFSGLAGQCSCIEYEKSEYVWAVLSDNEHKNFEALSESCSRMDNDEMTNSLTHYDTMVWLFANIFASDPPSQIFFQWNEINFNQCHLAADNTVRKKFFSRHTNVF